MGWHSAFWNVGQTWGTKKVVIHSPNPTSQSGSVAPAAGLASHAAHASVAALDPDGHWNLKPPPRTMASFPGSSAIPTMGVLEVESR